MFKALLILIFFVALASPGFSAPVQETYTFLFDRANPPFMYIDRKGELRGIYPTVMHRLLEELRIKHKFSAVPWKRAISLLAKEKIGIVGIYKNDERAKLFVFSEPLFFETVNVYTRSSERITYRRPGDLRGRRVGMIRGWYYDDDIEFLQKAEPQLFTEVHGDLQNFEMLENGRIDAVFATNETWDVFRWIEAYRGIIESSVPLFARDTHLAFHKKYADDNFFRRFNAALMKARHDPAWNQMIKREIRLALQVYRNEPMEFQQLSGVPYDLHR